MSPSKVAVVGVDACPLGWVATVIEDDITNIETYVKFGELTESYSDAARILVDIPIGLPETERRRCDRKARELLGCRKSSVFFPPCSVAIDKGNHDMANKAHREQLGHGLSQQAHYISPKIQQVSIVAGEQYDGQVRESHPELCFAALNRQPVAYPKSSALGRGLRMQLLGDELDNAVELYQNTREEYLLKEVRRDDILDSMVLAVAACDDSPDPLPSEPASDEPRIYFPGFDVPVIPVE